MSSSRIALALAVQRLRERDLTFDQVAERLGISRSYASALATDPDGSKERARKDSYRGSCEVCGKPTCGAFGPGLAPKFCIQHSDHGAYTRDDVIEMFQAFHTATGRAPSSADTHRNSPSARAKLNPSKLRSLDVCRPPLPVPAAVKRLFGSWPAAVEAAGLEPPKVGGGRSRGPLQREVIGYRAGKIFRPDDIQTQPSSYYGRRDACRILAELGFLERLPKAKPDRRAARYRRTKLKEYL